MAQLTDPSAPVSEVLLQRLIQQAEVPVLHGKGQQHHSKDADPAPTGILPLNPALFRAGKEATLQRAKYRACGEKDERFIDRNPKSQSPRDAGRNHPGPRLCPWS